MPLPRERLFSVSEIVEATGGRLVSGGAEASGATGGSPYVTGVTLDSRRVAPGDLFVAIVGERVDGHSFVLPSLAAGAAAALISRWPLPGGEGGTRLGMDGAPDGMDAPDAPGVLGALGVKSVILVRDTVSALGALAAYHRKKFGFRAIGITGSVGKTTTKDLTAAVLSRRFTTLASEGNLNSDLGLPLIVFRARPDHQVAVFEMAMRGPGQIRDLCDIVHPVVGAITNVGPTHIELLGSVEAIADTKAELLESLPADGVAVLNADDPWTPRLARHAGGRRVIYYGTGAGGGVGDAPAASAVVPEVRGVDAVSHGEQGFSLTVVTPAGEARCTVPIPGLHNVANALAAAAVGLAFGLGIEEIARSLEGPALTGQRVQVHRTGRYTVIDDTYNASPASTLAALAVLDEVGKGGRRIFVFANMLELGAHAAEGHAEVGRDVARRQPDWFLTVGDLAAGAAQTAIGAGFPAARVVQNRGNSEAIGVLRDLLRDGDTILVKGSRGMTLEKVVAALTGKEGPSH